MGLRVYGVQRLMNELELKFSKEQIKSIVDEALIAGALILGMELRRQIRTFSDGTGYSKGYTLDEITISEPLDKLGNRTITVHWKGKHGRYRIIHLNEWGTIKNPNPRGKGKIAKAMALSQQAYGKAVRDVLRRRL